MFTRLRKRILPAVVLATLLAAVASLVAAETIDPTSSDAQYAWGENVGWINAEPAGGQGVTVSGLNLTGYMWGENIGWIVFDYTTSAANRMHCRIRKAPRSRCRDRNWRASPAARVKWPAVF